MNRVLYFLLVQIIFGIQIVSAENLYYWYRGNRVPLTIGERYFVLTALDDSFSWQISPQTKNGADVYYQSSTYKCKGQETYISNKFYVKLFDYSDTVFLHSIANEKNVDVLREISFAPQTYVLACSSSSAGNALEMANFFYETNIFEYSEPEFLLLDKYCANDFYFDSQWNLENDTNNDINFCGAKNITHGNSNIKIAIVDDGIYEGHTDLLVSDRFTIDNNSFLSFSYIYGQHATKCAGIINARNNFAGISGIAPECSLLSASVMTPSSESYAYAIQYAVSYYNADVILLPWGSSVAINSILDAAIFQALTDGRHGLGTVVVCPSGNHYPYEDWGNEQIKYPANLYEDLLVVGAIKQNGKRQTLTNGSGWSSCYGYELDVVAPGVNIPTTSYTTQAGFDNEGYSFNFSGTCAAAAHVAAIAGLILSVKPSLNRGEVNKYIEKTAKKLSSYDFGTHSNHPNGSWNIEVGHGLVDAYRALQEISGVKYIQNVIYQPNTLSEITADTIIAGYSVTNEHPYGNVVVQNGSSVTFLASKRIELHAGFSVEQGATFSAVIGSPSQQSSVPALVGNRNNHIFGGESSKANVIRHHKNMFSISPNPVNSILHFQTTEDLVQVKIYNINGQCVLQTTDMDIDVSALSQGMYVLHAETSNDVTHKAKFIKQ